MGQVRKTLPGKAHSWYKSQNLKLSFLKHTSSKWITCTTCHCNTVCCRQHTQTAATDVNYGATDTKLETILELVAHWCHYKCSVFWVNVRELNYGPAKGIIFFIFLVLILSCPYIQYFCTFWVVKHKWTEIKNGQI